MIVGLDFETRSEVDLKACGADVYASDPSTDIICCSFINKDNGQEWLWYPGQKIPHELILALQLATDVEAHNARFDELIYECIAVSDYGFPILPKEKWVCTIAQCRVNAMPASLDAATRAADAKHKKDHTGSALIRKLCVPKDGVFNTDPTLIAKMGKYCMKDSRAMVGLTNTLRPLSDIDKRDWQINERINDRGILVDIELATLAQAYAAQEKDELGRQLSNLTDGAITKVTQTTKFLKVLKEELPAELMHCVQKPRKAASDPVKYTLDKAARGLLLEEEGLEPHHRDIITLIHEGGNSSVSKFTAMLNRADPITGRVHGAFIFAGAGQTQRYSSKGLQLHNMRRDCHSADEAEILKAKMRRGESIGEPVMDVLAKMLRPTVVPAKGHKFIVGDWSAIEARVLPWLSDSPGGRKVLDRFRHYDANPEKGDIYTATASDMSMDDRQIGKVAVLSLGFGGAVGAFQSMAKNYGVTISDSYALSVVGKWRRANPWAVKFWGELEKAALKAVRRPRTVHAAGRVKYVFTPELLGGTLFCILPNDTVIQYPYARIDRGNVTAMKASVQPKSDSEDEWPRMSLWGGFLAENITQASSACLLRELLADMVEDEFPVVGHCHDEVILEPHDYEVDVMLEECQSYMEACPEWAKGLPLRAVPEVFTRYGK